VVATVFDDDKTAWYQLQEGYTPWRPSVYVPASSLQLIAPQELAPISPGHPDKRIEIDRAAQTLTCLEGERAVFETTVATGHPGTATPRGEFRVLYKRHTRRMAVSNIADPYDLPGVAFPVYFTWSGVAIHGTYWHNDYGRVHSHGCVNATADAARWIFRWVEPVISYEDYTQKAEPAEAGTRVVVV
jgi:lipoprotein-anchoring transpeptidase ErfK/SrfK